MSYQCPKGHTSTDPDYCSECGAKIGQSSAAPVTVKSVTKSAAQEICPDCGTPRAQDARFCEVCRYDFMDGKTGTAEKVVAASQPKVPDVPEVKEPVKEEKKEAEAASGGACIPAGSAEAADKSSANNDSNIISKDDIIIGQKLNIVILVDKVRLAQNTVETSIKPDSIDRVFPLDLNENLVGRRSNAKGIYPEIEINDPGVSHRHLKFIKQPDGSFAVLELGSANGTEYNGVQLDAGVPTVIKAGDEFAIGLWTTLKVVSR